MLSSQIKNQVPGERLYKNLAIDKTHEQKFFLVTNFEILCLDSNNEWWRCFYSRLNYFFTAAVVSEFIVQHTFEIIAIFVEFLLQQQAWKTFVDIAK